jgi:hypothetical protein
MMTHPSYEELNDYADGLVDDVARSTIDAHLTACADCAASLDAIKDLQLWAQSLPREVKAPADVWENVRAATIENALAQRSRILWGMRYHLAAAAIVLLVAASSITWYFARTQADPVAQQPASGGQAHLAAYRTVEAEYTQAANDLMVLMNQRRSTMDTAVVRAVEENLRLMDDAINKARAALLSDPSNQDVAGILAATQESKLRMLRRAVAASGT